MSKLDSSHLLTDIFNEFEISACWNWSTFNIYWC